MDETTSSKLKLHATIFRNQNFHQATSDKRKEWNNYSSIVVYHKYPAANPLLSKPEDQ
jgi:hypothetical protein